MLHSLWYGVGNHNIFDLENLPPNDFFDVAKFVQDLRDRDDE